MTAITITVLGPLRVFFGDRLVRLAAPPMTFPLLAYLLIHRRREVLRERLAFTLWPEETESAAKANLRRHIHYLHKLFAPAAVDEPCVVADARVVRWNPSFGDVEDFERHVAAGERAKAADIYDGDLFEGLEHEWVQTERERLRTMHAENLSAIVSHERAQRQLAKALHYARRLLNHDPWREDVLRDVAQ